MGEHTRNEPSGTDPESDKETGRPGIDPNAERDASPANAAPPISDQDQEQGHTQRPAPDDEVGVPADPGRDKS